MMIFIGSVGGFMQKQTPADVMYRQSEDLFTSSAPVWSPSQSQCL